MFTNALPEEIPNPTGFLRLAPLVLRPGCVAKSAKKILLVEDNDEIRELLALFIKHLGYKVFAAARRTLVMTIGIDLDACRAA
jgi:hypothetical protein